MTSRFFAGIDYGTTKSAIAIYPDSGDVGPFTFQIEPGVGDQKYLLSVVKLQRSTESTHEIFTIDGNNAIGHAALFAEKVDKPDVHTFMHAKLDIGLPNFSIERTPPPSFQSIKPQDIATLIINHLKTKVEHDKKTKLQSVTISVPANWDPVQRQATKSAALLAGFTDVALIEEPVAALVYLDKREQFRAAPNQKIMVIDFGGGTCDIAIIRMLTIQTRLTRWVPSISKFRARPMTPHVQRVVGNNALGGQLINKILLSKYPKEVPSSPSQKNALLQDIENLKVFLNRPMARVARQYCQDNKIDAHNHDESSRLLLDSYSDDIKMPIIDSEGEAWWVTAQEFHNWLNDEIQPGLCNDLYPEGRSVIQAFRDLVKDAISFSDDAPIDKVFVVGGSSLLYFVQPIVLELLPKLKLDESLIQPNDPVECVALGTALHEAARHKGNETFASRFFYNLAISVNGDSGLSSPVARTTRPCEILLNLQTEITKNFDLDTIRRFAMKLDVPYEELQSDGTGSTVPVAFTETVKKLTLYMWRKNRLQDLLALCTKEAPKVDWKVDLFTAVEPDSKQLSVRPVWILKSGSEGKVLPHKEPRSDPPLQISDHVRELSVTIYESGTESPLANKKIVEVQGKVAEPGTMLWAIVQVDKDGIVNVEVTNPNSRIKMVEEVIFPVDITSDLFKDRFNLIRKRLSNLNQET